MSHLLFFSESQSHGGKGTAELPKRKRARGGRTKAEVLSGEAATMLSLWSGAYVGRQCAARAAGCTWQPATLRYAA